MLCGYQTGKWKAFVKLMVSYLIKLATIQQGGNFLVSYKPTFLKLSLVIHHLLSRAVPDGEGTED